MSDVLEKLWSNLLTTVTPHTPRQVCMVPGPRESTFQTSMLIVTLFDLDVCFERNEKLCVKVRILLPIILELLSTRQI